ncbi:MAG: class I SAM-dependent methyltransferase [Candidatus Omnitrophota bacterium]
MSYKGINYLHNKVIEILEGEPRVRLLDLGAGGGNLTKQAKDKGFDVVALDADEGRFQYKNEIDFRKGDLTQGLPFEDGSFDCVVMLEVIEHLKDPYFVLREINRILKKDGFLLLSTPNILNLKSRVRFLFEGTYDYFREPPLELAVSPKHRFFDIHVFAYKYPELEYILFDAGFSIDNIFASVFELQAMGFSLIFLPMMKLQAYFKCRRAQKKGDMDYRRIFKILFSPELLYGRHLIIKARKRE